MFALKNLGKLIFGDGTSPASLIELQAGQLYLVRPLSPKGYSELIFKDSAASIRKTGQEFQYQLVIQRAYEEGEEVLDDEDEGDASIAALAAERDEKTFLLDESLHFRSEVRDGGEKVLAWRDLSGDAGDLYEFVCDNSIDNAQVQAFETIAVNCQYERKYRKSHQTATATDLAQFSFDNEQPIPSASPTHSPTIQSPVMPSVASSQALKNSANSSIKRERENTPSKARSSRQEPQRDETPTEAPDVATHPERLSVLAEELAELHLFDFQSGSFIIQDSLVRATVSEVGNWKYWLQITGEQKDWLGQAVVADINPVFNFEYLSFIFNAYTPTGDAYSWLLRFKGQEPLERFQEGLMQALWEQLNEIKWHKNTEEDREYVLETFQDLKMEDAQPEERDDPEEEEEEEIEDEGQKSEHYDSDEEEEDVITRPNDGKVNSQLAVGYAHDRSFVVRGDQIGVFRHAPNNVLEFSTNISKVQTPGGKAFNPKKVMLHAEDRNLIMQNEANPNSVFRMDLELGKVVEEWKVHDDIPVDVFTPASKFAQMTGEQTFLGLSNNALYRIDPRLAGNKMVDTEFKQWKTNNDFSAAATTDKGYVAVASNKGDIRLFDKLGKIAKTALPALGDPMIGIDVSADGRWILATCRTYLLLIDALQKEGKNEGKLGFEKAFGKDSKPQPRRLGLTPSHVAQFQHETGAALSFTPARFNTAEGKEETFIITSTGPFVVTWNMKKLLRGSKDPYSIKRYSEEVKADNWRYGSDKNAIVALPNEVNMVNRTTFKKPTRESIVTAARLGGGSFGGRRSDAGRVGTRDSARYKLGKEDIVDSPY